MTAISLTVNGRRQSAEVEPRTHLADFLREDLLLTGTHLGCEHGVCGACTLMVDGRPVRSCLTFAASCDGAEVQTVEGFEDDPLMTRLRDAFSRHHALQCGYCTPGMLATAYDIVRRLPEADEPRIREELAGNLCRCTGYAGIVAAIAEVLADPLTAPLQPRERPALSAAENGPQPPAAATASARPAATSFATTLPIPERIDGGVTLERRLSLDIAPQALWTLLEDFQAVVACLPGASLESVPEGPGEPVTGSFTVAIGPMRAQFRGRALVAYDEVRRTGLVRGTGGDPVSRSQAEGQMRFAVEAGADTAGSVLVVALVYRLKGPLSQFGRPAIVADVVDRLLARFADNLAALAEGRGPVHAAPMSGFGLIFETISMRVQKLLARLRG
ncbi:2Fe-2S iron-sulfur cluster binding domain-containing protein [Jiella endophytica]|uniref:2Fe-2S iron-sulfur cluster binding domain-containing protein n=1 Tax=Jiella endophytica TaxID=2558362 RepID=A0A4Y8RS03_9HYPH|nr:2Fe-2S iron-sulfur cluster-binding protein [Jiella endophytica]TFF27099.1 2Fe-2S iron-sulfur cluster binding domain-containing protein [Jiella endophytica]